MKWRRERTAAEGPLEARASQLPSPTALRSLGSVCRTHDGVA